jgi:hypothetical protein
MATITGYTAERMKQIEDAAIVDGEVVSGNLFLYPKNYPVGAAVNAGSVIGPAGPQGLPGDITEAEVDAKIAAAIYPQSNPRNVRVNRTTPFGIAHNTYTTISSWDSESWDNGAMHSMDTNPSRLTVPTGSTGLYQLVINLTFVPELGVTPRERGGTRMVMVRKNNAEVERFQMDPTSPFTNFSMSNTVNLYLNQSQYIEIQIYHFTGIWQNMTGSVALSRIGA